MKTVTSDMMHKVAQPSLMISVSDTGEEIAPEHLSHIFERFCRVGDSRARVEGETGLGLSIVRQMALAYGGHIWVSSEVEKAAHSIWYYRSVQQGTRLVSI